MMLTFEIGKGGDTMPVAWLSVLLLSVLLLLLLLPLGCEHVVIVSYATPAGTRKGRAGSSMPLFVTRCHFFSPATALSLSSSISSSSSSSLLSLSLLPRALLIPSSALSSSLTPGS
ncbi:hypothetical protein BDR22DRAFT_873595 [Usnea florida]